MRLLILVLLAHANAECQIKGGTVQCMNFEEFEERNLKTTTVAIIGRLRGAVSLMQFEHLERFVVLHSDVRCNVLKGTRTQPYRSMA